jgi:hypothetical protein
LNHRERRKKLPEETLNQAPNNFSRIIIKSLSQLAGNVARLSEVSSDCEVLIRNSAGGSPLGGTIPNSTLDKYGSNGTLDEVHLLTLLNTLINDQGGYIF